MQEMCQQVKISADFKTSRNKLRNWQQSFYRQETSSCFDLEIFGSTLLNQNSYMKLKSTLTILALLCLFCGVAQSQTTDVSLSFTNVAVEAYSGYQYEGNTSKSAALLGANIDLWSFNAGKVGKLDFGLGTEMTIDDSSATVHSLSLRPVFTKNLEQTQIYGFFGGGREFADAPSWYFEFGGGVNYNLYRAQNWFTFVGTGIDFRVINGSRVDYLPVVKAGIAF